MRRNGIRDSRHPSGLRLYQFRQAIAQAIAEADGQTWWALGPQERERYERLADAAEAAINVNR